MSPSAGAPDEGLIVETLDVLQADVDDESPQVLGALIGRLLAEGALDAHLTPLVMKKNRPGIRIEVLARQADSRRLTVLLLRETSTLGVKSHPVQRTSLPRRQEIVTLHGHDVRLKVALLDGVVLRANPEFEDCKSVADVTGRPLREIIEEARALGRKLVGGS